MRQYVCFLLLLCVVPSRAVQPHDNGPYPAAQGTTTYTLTSPFYRMTLVQAAPGTLVQLIDAYKSQFRALKAAGDEEVTVSGIGSRTGKNERTAQLRNTALGGHR